jgi:1-deoxy-D-xylulose-5-phosphate synthase
MTLLDSLTDPGALRRLNPSRLPEVADALRHELLHSVARTGGHLSANLGTVELSVALHHVYDTPHDRIIWDVGHQAYGHKILTGRRERMATLRQRGGISGFPRRDESPYDAFGTAHSSTSISAALGMAMAARLRDETRKVVAVIGDGALSAGMAYEGMNNAGAGDLDLLVILNDNDMSISPPVGALSEHLNRLMNGRFEAARQRLGQRLREFSPPLFELARQIEQHASGRVHNETLFAKLGFTYHGPIDGHDIHELVRRLSEMRQLKGPQFLHIVTRKGKGYAPAEADPIQYHGPGKFEPSQGLPKAATGTKPTYTQVFGRWLCDMAGHDPRLVGITPAMREGSGMVEFSQLFPRRYVDCGIAEQHAVTFAAGLACEGLKPVVAIYSTFLQRGYDQLIHDVALQNLPVVFALDRAGIVGADGATHAGVFDIPFLRCIPNMAIACPSDENECRELLTVAYAQDISVAVRYPRGSGPGVPIQMALPALDDVKALIGKAQIRREGHDLLLLAFGPMLAPALKVGEALDATVVNMRWVKPMDEALLLDLARRHSRIVVVEEGAVQGGAASAVMECLHQHRLQREVLALGVPDVFTEHGDPAGLLAELGLDATGIAQSIQRHWPDGGASVTPLHRVA